MISNLLIQASWEKAGVTQTYEISSWRPARVTWQPHWKEPRLTGPQQRRCYQRQEQEESSVDASNAKMVKQGKKHIRHHFLSPKLLLEKVHPVQVVHPIMSNCSSSRGTCLTHVHARPKSTKEDEGHKFGIFHVNFILEIP